MEKEAEEGAAAAPSPQGHGACRVQPQPLLLGRAVLQQRVGCRVGPNRQLMEDEQRRVKLG